MHTSNVFVTLTYSPEKLPKDGRLHYRDFELFMKRLRQSVYREKIKNFCFNPELPLSVKQQEKKYMAQFEISFFVTGEYGDQTHRPHWHAILFNCGFDDSKHHRTTELGDSVTTSQRLTDLWQNGHAEIGTVTFESAGYVARYATKKLVHGNDDAHDLHPVSKKSNRNAIGKKFLERYWTDIFNTGHCLVKTSEGYIKTSIPRYYVKWLEKNHPEAHTQYTNTLKKQLIEEALKKQQKETQSYIEQQDLATRTPNQPNVITRRQTKKLISKEKFNRLNEFRKGEF